MKKALLVALILMSFCALAETDDPWSVDALRGRSVEELYQIEDAVVSAIMDEFSAGSEKLPNGDRVGTYVINPRSKKYHYPYCYSALQIGESRQFAHCSASDLLAKGLSPCGQCNPYPRE